MLIHLFIYIFNKIKLDLNLEEILRINANKFYVQKNNDQKNHNTGHSTFSLNKTNKQVGSLYSFINLFFPGYNERNVKLVLY